MRMQMFKALVGFASPHQIQFSFQIRLMQKGDDSISGQYSRATVVHRQPIQKAIASMTDWASCIAKITKSSSQFVVLRNQLEEFGILALANL